MLDNRSAVPVWPAVTLLTDADGSMTLNQAQAAAAAGRFTAHGDTPSNLGRNANTVWLRFVVEVPGAESVHRALALDYPSLNRIDLHILKEGVLLETMVMSNQLGLGERLTPARTHAAPLYLQPGRHEMLLRVHTQSSLVLPTTLRTPEGFTASESRAQIELGIVIGLALCMLLYSLNGLAGPARPAVPGLRRPAGRQHAVCLRLLRPGRAIPVVRLARPVDADGTHGPDGGGGRRGAFHVCGHIGARNQPAHSPATTIYVFKRCFDFVHGSGDQSAGRIDCCRRGCLVLEAERVKTRRNTPGFDDVPMTVVWRHWRELRKTPPYTLATKPKSQAVTRSEEAFATDFEALLAAMETQIGR